MIKTFKDNRCHNCHLPYKTSNPHRKYCSDPCQTQHTNPKGTTPTNLYIIQIQPNGLVKIGISQDPHRRLAELQTANPHPLKLINHWPATPQDETFAHRRFARHHYRGEWYIPAPHLIDWATRKSQKIMNDLYTSLMPPKQKISLAG